MAPDPSALLARIRLTTPIIGLYDAPDPQAFAPGGRRQHRRECVAILLSVGDDRDPPRTQGARHLRQRPRLRVLGGDDPGIVAGAARVVACWFAGSSAGAVCVRPTRVLDGLSIASGPSAAPFAIGMSYSRTPS